MTRAVLADQSVPAAEPGRRWDGPGPENGAIGPDETERVEAPVEAVRDPAGGPPA